jgi:hypothetical protein
MESLSPDLISVLSLSAGLGLAMVLLGRGRGMLEHRATRRCPACGRLVGQRGECRCTR